MANPTTRVGGAGPASRRTMTAAARAAAKRRERRGRPELGEGGTPRGENRSGPTVAMEAPGGWNDPPEPSSEPAGEEAPKTVPARWRGRRALTVALGVVLVAAITVACVLGWRYREGRQADQARGQALAAAQQAAPVVLSYDYRHLDRDFARARAWLTGGFGDQYRKTTGTVVGPTAKKYHGVVSATVAAPSGGSPAASVVSATPDKAVVLLFVNQVTRSTQVTGSRLDLNRVRMTMTRTSSGWKVSAVDAL
ncbi:hypothetical protein RKE30_12230 [Streptomyces sp. Li-HN-5-11]|uniref:hypothetical protein n=1 Tax=Streptomyces sp. Li-HN-5-11 TaxID=3075432 RepID=UPI0028AA6BE3|nr:hypothetical protein [Streptomyces sp. Li-HN-5-11]WNM31128.1 hypothetical protein RKE30_12230 [Streptomyces sp. Li-HN-5-11]